MVTTQVDLIEKVGGGSCRCMLVEDWSSEASSIQFENQEEPAIATSHKGKFEFEITHTYDDFFDSDLETNSDDVSIQDDLPFNDYWDRQFECPIADMHEALADLDLP